MPKIHNNILCVTRAELVSCGLSEKYISVALNKQRKGEVYCWDHHKEGRQVYIHYDSLLDKYKKCIKESVCGGQDPLSHAITAEKLVASKKEAQLKQGIRSNIIVDDSDITTLQELKIYTNNEIQQIARSAAWLRHLNAMSIQKIRALGFDSVNKYREKVLDLLIEEQDPCNTLVKWKKGNISSVRWLTKLATNYKKEGIASLIHKGVGNVNREKVDTLIHAKLMELASNRVKYSFEDIGLKYNEWAEVQGKELLTVATLKKHLNKPKNKKVWFYARHGKLAADNEMQQLINRTKPSFPDALWSIDGTTMQLYYRDQDGKMKSDLYAYFITDANTGAIVGHSVALAETSNMVEDALKNAITKHKNKPYQLQYDNSSANVSAVVRNLMSNMARVHFPCEPYKGRSKYVEPIIGHFQQRVLRHYENFKGGNVTVKNLNSKANPELLTELKKNVDLLPSQSEVLNDFEAAIEIWNNRGEKRDAYGRWQGESKMHRYNTIEHAKRVKLNYFDILSLFMVEQRGTYRYGTNGITLEINGERKNFIVPDADGIGDFVFANEHLGKRFKVRVDRDRPDLIAIYTDKDIFLENGYVKEKHAACVADMTEGDAAKRIALKNKQEEFGVDYSRRELETQMELLHQYQATGTDGIGWWDTSKLENNAKESQQEDAINGVNDGLTQRQRKILNIGK